MATNTSLKDQLRARAILYSQSVKAQKEKEKEVKGLVLEEAQPELKATTFQLGSKAYVQLALRTGLYKTLNVIEVFEGQLKFWDPVSERLIIDTEAKLSKKIIGYAGYFELFNGFTKCIYVPKQSLYNLSSKIDRGAANHKRLVLRELLLKWGILSLETESAFVPELKDTVLLYKPLLKDEELYSVDKKEGTKDVG